MLALSFRAGSARYAVRAADIVRLLEARPLAEVVAAPPCVTGLLAFEDDLLPVLDLGLLLEGQATLSASRMLVVQIAERPPRRLVLVVSEAWDMVEVRTTLPRLARRDAAFLGDFVRDAGDAQLIDLAKLLPEELRAMARAPRPEPSTTPGAVT